MQVKNKWYDFIGSLGFVSFASSSLVLSLSLLQMSDELGLNLTQGGILIAMPGFMILPRLFLRCWTSVKWGLLTGIKWGIGGQALSILILSFAQNFWHLLIGMLLLGVMQGLVYLIVPLIQKVYGSRAGIHQNFVTSFWSFGIVMTALLAGILLADAANWRLLFRWVAAFSLLSFLMLFLLPKEPFRLLENPLHGSIKIMKSINFWLFALVLTMGGILEAGYTFWSASYIQLKWASLNDPAVVKYGVWGTASFAFGMFAGRQVTARLSRFMSQFAIVVVSSVLGIVVSFFVFNAESIAEVLILLGLLGLSVACYAPSLQVWCAHSMADVDSSIVLILISCFLSGGINASNALFGYLGDTYGLNSVLKIMPWVFLFILLMCVFLHLRERKYAKEANTQ